MSADIIHIAKTDEHFRLLYDSKGRFVTHRVTAEEGKVRQNTPTIRCILAQSGDVRMHAAGKGSNKL